MARSNNDADIRQCQSDGPLVQPMSNSAPSNASEIDTLILAMRQLMQLPGQTKEQCQQV